MLFSHSSSSDAFILVEMTVPWEDRIEASNAMLGKSAYTFLTWFVEPGKN